jgi:glycosyltransferase involved in cell wall biosynthesis
MVTISVVIPSLNDAHFLRVCLDALARQTRPADEIVVVDNGSVDNTAAVATRAGARVITEPLRGIFPATSAGFDAATGDILARLDTDSIPPLDWLERIERSLEHVAVPAAVTGTATFYGGNRAVHWIGETLYLGLYFTAMRWLIGHPPVFGSNFAMHRELWALSGDRAHRRRADVHDDLDLSIHFPSGTTVVFDRELLVGVSARPLMTLPALGRRIRMAISTLVLNAIERPFFLRRRDFRSGQPAAARERLRLRLPR